jgi:hypothetical protein
VILLSAGSAWPVYHFGEAGDDRVISIADHDGGLWLDEHVHRAETMEPIFYITAALALAAIAFPRKWPCTDIPLSAASGVLALLTIAAAAWIAYAGGRIRHREFRNEPAPHVHERHRE